MSDVTRVVATRVRIAENELDQIKPGTPLYQRAVDSLDETRDGRHYIERAEEIYAKDGEIEIDDDAAVSIGFDAGAYVQGWLWVPDDEFDADDEDEYDDA